MKTEKGGFGKLFTVIRLFLGIAFLVLLVMFILPVFGGVFNIGNISGAFFCCVMLFVTFGNSVFMKMVNHLRQSAGGKILVYGVLVLFILGIAYAGFLTGLIIHADHTAPEENCTVVVLGCQVFGDHPSLMLKERILSAYDYLEEHPDVPCIVTGGKGDDEHISEAQCMYDYLVDLGISPDRIYMEDKAVNTVENIAFSKEIIMENNLSTNTAIVTDIFHEYRASNIVKDAELVYGSVPAKCTWYLLPTFYVRELIAITASFVGLA